MAHATRSKAGSQAAADEPFSASQLAAINIMITSAVKSALQPQPQREAVAPSHTPDAVGRYVIPRPAPAPVDAQASVDAQGVNGRDQVRDDGYDNAPPLLLRPAHPNGDRASSQPRSLLSAAARAANTDESDDRSDDDGTSNHDDGVGSASGRSSTSTTATSTSSPASARSLLFPHPERLVREGPSALAREGYDPHVGFFQRADHARTNARWLARRMQKSSGLQSDSNLSADIQSVTRPTFNWPSSVNRLDSAGKRITTSVQPAAKDEIKHALAPVWTILRPTAAALDAAYVAAVEEARTTSADYETLSEAELVEEFDELRFIATVREAVICALVQIDVRFFELQAAHLANRNVLPSSLTIEHQRRLNMANPSDAIVDKRFEELSQQSYNRMASLRLHKEMPDVLRLANKQQPQQQQPQPQPQPKQQQPAAKNKPPKDKPADKPAADRKQETPPKKEVKEKEKQKTDAPPAQPSGGTGKQ